MNATTGPRAPALDAVLVSNPAAPGRYVVVCEHASNAIPLRYGSLGLSANDLTRHIAWDPGAREVAAMLAARLEAPLVEGLVSRLVIDCNRPPDAPDLIAEISETTPVPGNRNLSDAERRWRVDHVHRVFHAALDALVEARAKAGMGVAIVTVHSFNPVYRGVNRPWHVGVIFDDDQRLAAPLIDGLKRIEGVTVGVNEPYSPADRVYYTLERHARPHDIPCAMIEIRNDEIGTENGQRFWSERLAGILSGIAGLEAAESSSGAPGVAGGRARA